MTDGGIEKKMQTKFKIKLWTLISGVSGCFCFGGGDWLIPVCEGLMLPVFLYWFYLQITGNTIFKKGMAFTNVLVIFGMPLRFYEVLQTFPGVCFMRSNEKLWR